MSVDLSDLEIKRIRGELLDPSSVTSWYVSVFITPPSHYESLCNGTPIGSSSKACLNGTSVAHLRQSSRSPTHPHSRFLLHYNPSSTSPALAVVASGHDPVLEQWKEQITKLQEGGESVAYGYGEFKGKGCVLLFLDDSIA
jgi:hypothetical protein